MRKLLLISLVAVYMGMLATIAFAAPDKSVLTSVSVDVVSEFSIAFDDDFHYVSYPGGGPVHFTADPGSNLNYADLHNPLMSDIGLIIKSNESSTWYLKTAVSANLAGAMLYYMGQPTVSGMPTTGTLTNPAPPVGLPWPVMPNGTTYTSGNDTLNTPNGTYAGISLGIDGGGLAPGTLEGSVTFTITQSP